jgi:RNA polymerase sigma factor (sigma-70 family)
MSAGFRRWRRGGSRRGRLLSEQESIRRDLRVIPADPGRFGARTIRVLLTPPALPRSLRAVAAAAPHDAAILARIKAGDDRALAVAYEEHADLVYGLARRVTRDEQLARDVTQEVFAHLWELPALVDLERGSLRGYLAVLAHRRAVDEVRRSERRARVERRARLDTAVRAGQDDGPEPGVVETLTDAWRRERLAAALAELPPDQRAAIELAYYDGLTYTQVARALGIPEGTAKSRLRLAMTRLRMRLGDEMRAAIQ